MVRDHFYDPDGLFFVSRPYGVELRRNSLSENGKTIGRTGLRETCFTSCLIVRRIDYCKLVEIVPCVKFHYPMSQNRTLLKKLHPLVCPHSLIAFGKFLHGRRIRVFPRRKKGRMARPRCF